MKWLGCSEPKYPEPRRNLVRGELPINARTRLLFRLYRPGAYHIYFPPGYKERLATRGALAPEPDDD